MIRLVLTGFAALLGLAFGSFLNVCLTRWPAEESIIRPRSHCRQCGRTLAWWENIPVASWLALRGRCRTCKTWIGWRYPIVELVVGGLWAWAAWRSFQVFFAPPLFAVGMGIFFWLLVALAVLDAEHLWLPNSLTLTGTVIGFAWQFIMMKIIRMALEFPGDPWENVKAAWHILFGILIAAGLVLVIRWAYWLFRKQEGMGLGDAKLMAMMAAWLGLSGALLSFALAVVMGAAFAFVVLAMPKARRGAKSWVTTPLPFGTFLCIAGVVSAMWGPRIVDAYLRWSGLK